MAPLERALQDEDKINYCDECENWLVVGNVAYCRKSGKLIHPLMFARGQGYGPARRCKNAKRKADEGVYGEIQ